MNTTKPLDYIRNQASDPEMRLLLDECIRQASCDRVLLSEVPIMQCLIRMACKIKELEAKLENK